MDEIICPTCGAGDGMNCSTVRGNDHRKRMLLEIAQLAPRCSCMEPANNLHPVEPCPIHGRSVQ